jgi:dipeptidyl aminopeptidase/acylaminoacyl peptidase
MRALRMALVLLLASSILVVVPGEVDATVPGAIGRIAYVSEAIDPLGDIYVRDFSGGTPIRLTTSTEPDYSPRWSPDGDYIAFGRANGGGGGTDVFVMAPDGSGQTNLTNGGGTSNIPLAWAPDSMRILMASDSSGQNDLWMIRPDGSDPVKLTDTADLERYAAWSPDGSTIAFDRITPGSASIWLMDADGSNARSITGTTGTYLMPAWSPDGMKIAYVDGNASYGDIWVMNADGSNMINLTNSALADESNPRWSPDGTRILYTSDADGDYDIWVMNADGTGKAHATDHVSNESDATWESVNRLPIAVNDEATVHRGRSVEIAPLSNDSDLDGEMLELGDITRMPGEGTVSVDPGGIVTYTHNGLVAPRGHVVPYTDSFDYRVDDERLGSSIGTVQVWIYPYFDDVPLGHTFFDHVLWLAVQGITYGCNPPDDTLFCPDDHVTRGQMAAFLVRARGYLDGGEADLFVDDNGSVFEVSIDKLGTAGVTLGCNPPVNDRFCPDSYVTRGQMAAFLVRAFDLQDLGMHDLFIDDNGSMFEASIDKLGATGVSKGCNPPVNDHFCPDDYVTRGQMAAFIGRAVAWGEE